MLWQAARSHHLYSRCVVGETWTSIPDACITGEYDQPLLFANKFLLLSIKNSYFSSLRELEYNCLLKSLLHEFCFSSIFEIEH